MSAPGSINRAPLVFTSADVGFMRARSAAVTIPRVASTSGMCSERTSQGSKNASLLTGEGAQRDVIVVKDGDSHRGPVLR